MAKDSAGRVIGKLLLTAVAIVLILFGLLVVLGGVLSLDTQPGC